MYMYRYTYMYMYMYMLRPITNEEGPSTASFVYGFYHHFNNLRFRKSQNLNVCSAAHVAISFCLRVTIDMKGIEMVVRPPYTRSPLEHSRLFGPSPWKI